MLQDIIVTLIVLAATGYSAWKLAPAALRNALAARSGAIARAGGASDKLARRIEIKALAAAEKAGGCGSGSCGPCKGCAVGQAAEKDKTHG
jgi:hypothetical protein